MYHTTLTCYEQENLRHRAHFEVFSKALRFSASTPVKRRITKTLQVGVVQAGTRVA